jgi:hypothetical protein
MTPQVGPIVFAAALLSACGSPPTAPSTPKGIDLSPLTGRYTLTIIAAPECAIGGGDGSLPEAARERRYAADVQQDGERLRLTLTSPTLRYAVRGAGIWSNGENVRFDFTWLDEGFPVMEDVLDNGSTFFIEGSASTSFDVVRLEGSFLGRLSLVQGRDTLAPPVASCNSDRHRFVMAR